MDTKKNTANNLADLIFINVPDSSNKTILEVGGHDDSLTLELAKKFKQVYAYYEFVKVPERTEKNFQIKKIPYLSVLKHLHDFDVILIENEFHHFPDIWQLWTYDKLKRGQKLFLVEWDYKGNLDEYYLAFQNCRPLCELTRQIMEKSVENGLIKITNKLNSKFETPIHSQQEIIDYYKFMLPDHWRFGEKEFMSMIKNLTYPLNVIEGFDLFIIEKA